MARGQTEEIRTCPDPVIDACVAGAPGMRHDWRFFEYSEPHEAEVSSCFRCVWCHAISCGNYEDPDPCWEPFRHPGAHESRAGVRWPKGSNR